MTNEQLFDNIEEALLPILQTYMQTGKATITPDEKIILRDTYSVVHPGVTLDLACSTCITTALHILMSYYEREKPKQPITTAAITTAGGNDKKTTRKRK